MKNSEISALSAEELTAKLSEDKGTLTKMKFAHAVSTIENPNRIKNLRREIARVSTELSKRKAESASEPKQ